jgi:parallel beta-helix repeat protein
VHVYEGTYYENLVVSKALTIQGADKETTILQAQPVGYGGKAIEIKSSNVIISGFTISGYAPTETKPYYTYWGIYAYGSSTSHYTNIVVTDNIFTFLTQNGIQLGYVDGGLVANNVFKRETRLVWYDPPGPTPGSYINVTRGGSGPALWVCTNIVIDPNIIQTDGVGIFLYSSSNILIESNIISAPDTTNPSDVGIHIQSCTNIDIIGNTIQNFTAGPKQYYTWGTTGAGINVYVSKAINIENNNLHSNTIGVLVQRLNHTTEPREVNIHYNNFEGNTEFGVLNCYSWVGKDKTYTPTNASFVVDARFNWWGHETGPLHETSWMYMGEPYGPHYGLGDSVSDYVLYDPWLKTPFTPPPIHDVAVINVVASPSRAVVGTTVQVNVTVKNEGNTYETFDVSLSYNSHLIGTQTIIDLAPSITTFLTFNWDTTGLSVGDYLLTAVASTVPGETDIADNTKSIKVRIGSTAPTIKVDPEIYNAQMLNKTFTINIKISDLGEYWRTIGVQFRLCYDDTLLEVIDVSEGPFMKDPRWNLHGTFFIYFVEVDPQYGPMVLVGILLLPNDTGMWEAFPSGDCVLATITFKTIRQERGLEKPPLTCGLTLKDTMIIDDDLEEIPHNLEHGIYKMYPNHIGDFNWDYKVDMKDIGRVSRAFGETPERPRWDPVCDTNNDGKIDMWDIGITAKGFGWAPTYDP